MSTLLLMPARLVRDVAPEALTPLDARELRRVDTATRPGAIRRGPGQSRVSFTTGVSANVIRSFVAHRRDGSLLSLGYTVGGTLFLDVAPTSAARESDYD